MKKVCVSHLLRVDGVQKLPQKIWPWYCDLTLWPLTLTLATLTLESMSKIEMHFDLDLDLSPWPLWPWPWPSLPWTTFPGQYAENWNFTILTMVTLTYDLDLQSLPRYVGPWCACASVGPTVQPAERKQTPRCIHTQTDATENITSSANILGV